MDSGDYHSYLFLQVIFNEPAISLVIAFVTIFILFMLAAFLSAGERVLFSLSPDAIINLKERRSIKDRLILQMLERPQQTRDTIYTIRLILHLSIFFLGIYQIRSLLLRPTDSGFLYILVAISFFFLFFIFDGILPNFIVKRFFLQLETGKRPNSKDPDEQEMLEDIQDFYHKTVDEIMIPRLDMTTIEMQCNFKEVLDIVIKSGFSRIPVYEETEDNIKGILYVKDLLQAIENPVSIEWKNLIHPAYFVPETKKIDDLLEEFRKDRIHIALVVDEFGCTSGLVTLEDIIEEIVGEISDEYDSDEKHFLRLPDGSYIFEGKILLNDFFRETDIEEEEFGKISEEVDTLAGLLLKIKGTLPRRREVIDYKQYRFRILEADERRVLKVKYSYLEQTPANKAGLSIVVGLMLLIFGAFSCVDSSSTPKPRGFYRIDLPEAQYLNFSLDDFPCSFNVSQLVTVELPAEDTSGNWLNLTYPTLNVKIYCSYHQITPADLAVLDNECRELVAKNARNADAITEQWYENPEMRVYGMLFSIEGETVSPVQFMLTDSTTHFFRGALFYECKPNVDSLAPVTHYLNENVIELIQSFHWQ